MYLNFNIIVLYSVMLLINVKSRQIKVKDSLLENQKTNTIFTSNSELKYTFIKQLVRCYLYSKTMPFEERIDYLNMLRRKVITFYAVNAHQPSYGIFKYKKINHFRS